jgi:diguanylate cyclase (GGDEF)-like protein
MDSMISLKKHIESWQETLPDDPALCAYRALLGAAGKAGRRAVPEIGLNLEQKLTELATSLAPPVEPAMIAGIEQRAEKELEAWAEQAFLRHEASERDLREIVDVMGKAIASVGENDARYTQEAVHISARLRTIAVMSDLAAIRRSILESANSLTACIERIAEDGRQSLLRLSAEVEDYRGRLVKSERLSSLDPLTGLANRRCFEERLNVKINAAKRFCLILIDLNDFKTINDRFGHLAGDEVLKYFAAKLRLQFPSADLVARWGGDEFAVIITSSQRDAEARVHRIRRSALGECTVDVGRQSIEVTVDGSIGVVEWDGGESGPEMLARADLCMYRGKESMKTKESLKTRESAQIMMRVG